MNPRHSPLPLILSRSIPEPWKAERIKPAAGRRSMRLPAASNICLTDFRTSNGPDVHVLLARAEDQSLNQEIVKGELDSVELGALKGNQGDQNYDVQSSVDLNKYNAVVIYCERFHAVFGVARLEQF